MSDCARVAITPDGELVVNLVRHDRTDHLGEGLTNPANMGFVPTEMLLMRAPRWRPHLEGADADSAAVGGSQLRDLLAGHVLARRAVAAADVALDGLGGTASKRQPHGRFRFSGPRPDLA